EECAVEPSPLFQRPVTAVASYNSPPPFSSSMRGHFFVPFPPDGASEQEVQQRLENNSYASIPTTAVHEAYPGHHWHLVTAKRNPANVPEPTARAEVARYCAWPTQASAYLTGCLEILRIRERFLNERGGSLRDFHDRVAASGGLPIALAERAALNPPQTGS